MEGGGGGGDGDWMFACLVGWEIQFQNIRNRRFYFQPHFLIILHGQLRPPPPLQQQQHLCYTQSLDIEGLRKPEDGRV